MEKMEEPGVVNPDAGFALIVNYLPPSFSDHDLHHLFSDVGPLYSAKIMRNKVSARRVSTWSCPPPPFMELLLCS